MSWDIVLTAMLPENVLLAGVVLLIGMEILDARGALALGIVVVTAAATAAFGLYATGYAAVPFPQQYSIDPPGALAKGVVLALVVPVLLLAREDFGRDARFPLLLVSSLYGLCMLISAESFLTLFLGLELMSLPVYVLVLLGWRRLESAEAALKYLVLGGTASATLLMGVALLYGSGGSLTVRTFAAALGAADAMAVGGAALVLVALFLKAAIVPFHAWAPDAYEGASVPVTAYMAAIIKAGVLLAALRLFDTASAAGPVADLVAILPLVSIVWGNLAAMRQTSFRRMIAYSSIAHAGYLFYAFLGDGSYQAILFYLIAYGVMNVLAFAALPRGEDGAPRDRLDDLKGLFHRQPYAALAMAVAMLSLAGIPPLPGFIAKFLVFKNVMAAGYTLYAVLGLVASYLGIYFYLRVIQYLFMSPRAAGAADRELLHRPAIAASVICLAASVLLVVLPGWVIGLL